MDPRAARTAPACALTASAASRCAASHRPSRPPRISRSTRRPGSRVPTCCPTTAAAFAPDVAAELTALTADVNDTYADTVALLARAVGGQPHAVDAAIARVDPTGADVTVTLPDGSTDRTRLAFDGYPQTLEQVSAQLRGMVSRARAAAGDSIPITRLEREVAAAVGLTTFVTTVGDVTDIAPRLRQITFRGGLDAYASLGADQFLYVMVPRAPGTAIDDGFTMERRAELAEGGRPDGAYYTVRRWRPQAGELDMWFVRCDAGTVRGGEGE